MPNTNNKNSHRNTKSPMKTRPSTSRFAVAKEETFNFLHAKKEVDVGEESAAGHASAAIDAADSPPDMPWQTLEAGKAKDGVQ